MMDGDLYTWQYDVEDIGKPLNYVYFFVADKIHYIGKGAEKVEEIQSEYSPDEFLSICDTTRVPVEGGVPTTPGFYVVNSVPQSAHFVHRFNGHEWHVVNTRYGGRREEVHVEFVPMGLEAVEFFHNKHGYMELVGTALDDWGCPRENI